MAAAYNNQHSVIVQPSTTTAPNVHYNDHMIRSILVTIFCFFPTGICAIMKSSKAKREFANGDIQNGMISAREALKLSNITIAIGIICLILGIVMNVIQFFTTVQTVNNNNGNADYEN